jgi:hypothetical protein
MPLKRGKSDATRQENIEREIAAGKSPDQAIAIGYARQRKSSGMEPKEHFRPKGTPSGRVGNAGYVNHSDYSGSPADKSETTVDTRRQTGTKPTHSDGNF